MIISFGWTTPALLAGRKTVTRRSWTPKHASHFHAGQWVDAWNTSPRNVRGNPRRVAVIELTEEPFLQHQAQAPALDFDREGFTYLDSQGLLVGKESPLALWSRWHSMASEIVWVVRFELRHVSEDFPRDRICGDCGCVGGLHWIAWDGETFLGTRCLAHGGHKFWPLN